MRDKFTLKVGAGLTLNGITFDNLDSIVGKILKNLWLKTQVQMIYAYLQMLNAVILPTIK